MDFQKEVIDRSHALPVVVDFWAPWCGPCKVLGPIIEELAQENEGSWALIKVNSDENPELSSRYKIRGIPAVKMFHHGKVVAEFTGALPKVQIESWLEEHLPDERKILLAQLKDRYDSGVEVETEIEKFVVLHPSMDEGKLLLAKVKVFLDPQQALETIETMVSPHKYSDELDDLKSLADLMNCEFNPSGLADKIAEARQAVAKKNFDTALEKLIEVVMVDKNFCDEMPRRATIALFHLLGDHHELTKKHRRRFDMALY